MNLINSDLTNVKFKKLSSKWVCFGVIPNIAALIQISLQVVQSTIASEHIEMLLQHILLYQRILLGKNESVLSIVALFFQTVFLLSLSGRGCFAGILTLKFAKMTKKLNLFTPKK